MTDEAPAAAAPPRWAGVLVRLAGTVVAVWGAVLLALVGSFLTPLRVGTVLLPLSLLLAIGGNLVLTWFADQATGHRLLTLAPGLVWVLLSLIASDRTTEGDIVLYPQNWVATVYLLTGSATVAVAAYSVLALRRS